MSSEMFHAKKILSDDVLTRLKSLTDTSWAALLGVASSQEPVDKEVFYLELITLQLNCIEECIKLLKEEEFKHAREDSDVGLYGEHGPH